MKRYFFAAALVFSTVVFAEKELRNLPVGNRIDWHQPGEIKNQKYIIQLVSPQNYGNGIDRNLEMKNYDLSSAVSRAELTQDIQNLHDIYKIENDEKDAGKVTQASQDFPISKDVKVSLKYLNDLNGQLSESFVSRQGDPELVERMYEVSESINMNYKDIIFPKVQLGELISVLFFGLYNSRVGENPAPMNLKEKEIVDPADSSFWQKPVSVTNNDTEVGFDRAELPDYSQTVFEYTKPKTGFGTHAGFRVELGKQEYKVRLGEENRVAPFSARIVHALGFNSLPIDHVPALRVKYSKKIFREFNMRKALSFQVALGELDLFEYKHNSFIDPFRFLTKAILKNGKSVSAAELKASLMKSESREATQEDENYNAQIEDQIAELVFNHASIEKIEESNVSVGPWSWDEIRHVERRDIRGYGLLAAWLGQYDARTENTRLMLIKDGEGQRVLKLFVTDVGSGLGKSNPLFAIGPDKIDKFREDVVKSSLRNDGQMISKKFQTFTTNKCFEATNEQDAKWMFKYIDLLTEKQIKGALKVAGFNATETNEAYRKLMSRKENIREVLKVKNQSATAPAQY